jgi:hypothetical protein
MICLITAFFNFENSLISADITASFNGHHNVAQILYFTVNTMVFTLMHQEEYLFFRISIVFVMGYVLFMAYHYMAPYIDYSTQRFMSSLIGLLYFTVIMLIFAFFMENSMFHGTFFCYVFTSPFVILAILQNKYHGLDSVV